jgi:hypothetical protein
MKIVYLTNSIWTQTLYTSSFYNISVLEDGKTTSTAMLGNGILVSQVTIEKEKYWVRLEGTKVLLDYKEQIIEIY